MVLNLAELRNPSPSSDVGFHLLNDVESSDIYAGENLLACAPTTAEQ
jgi:hypothetical protein